jgi:alkylation response protein AidB-like acyl-CoA dehydrogenase
MLDFTLDAEQQMLADTIGRFSQERMRKVFRDADEAEELPADVVREGWEIGLLPTSLPEKYGGFGEHSAVTGAVAVEEFAWGDLAGTLAIMAPSTVAIPVMLCGTEAQKETYLPLFTDMEMPAATAALTEPRVQYDPRHLATTATRQNGHYVLEGTKTMVPLAGVSETFLVYAAEDGNTQAFFVPAGTEGLQITGREKLMGVRALPTFGLKLEKVTVPAENKLGGETGINFDLILNHSRVALGAAAVGLARAGFEYAREYAKNRRQFGEPIAHRQSIAFMLANMAIDVDAARLMVWETAWLLDKGQDVTREATVMKHFIDDMVLNVADRAVQTLGGYGYIREYPVELWLRNARGFATFDGLALV